MGKVIYLDRQLTRQEVKERYYLDDIYDRWLVDRFLDPNPPTYDGPVYRYRNGLLFKNNG